MSRSAPAYDVVVVGAGVMGAWTALQAVRSGRRTLLVDQFGPADHRATSTDASRILRFGHGSDAFYPGWVRFSLAAWQALGETAGEPVFVPTGVAWLAHRDDGFEAGTERTLGALGLRAERLAPTEAAGRWPGLSPDDLAFVVFEPEAGVLRAANAVGLVVRTFEAEGGALRLARVSAGRAQGASLADVVTDPGKRIAADRFVFAAGPWLPRLVPELPRSLITVTRQDVVFLGPAPGDGRFDAGALPTWIDYDRAVYGIPALDERGAKVALDAYGPPFDPDTDERVGDPGAQAALRDFLRLRLPDLAERPIIGGRVCQYESTPDTHFVIDRHPRFENVWLAGGGSGHGFKHGPAIGRYVVGLLDGAPGDLAPPDDRFSLLRERSGPAGLRSGSDTPRPVPGSSRPQRRAPAR